MILNLLFVQVQVHRNALFLLSQLLSFETDTHTYSVEACEVDLWSGHLSDAPGPFWEVKGPMDMWLFCWGLAWNQRPSNPQHRSLTPWATHRIFLLFYIDLFTNKNSQITPRPIKFLTHKNFCVRESSANWLWHLGLVTACCCLRPASSFAPEVGGHGWSSVSVWCWHPPWSSEWYQYRFQYPSPFWGACSDKKKNRQRMISLLRHLCQGIIFQLFGSR